MHIKLCFAFMLTLSLNTMLTLTARNESIITGYKTGSPSAENPKKESHVTENTENHSLSSIPTHMYDHRTINTKFKDFNTKLQSSNSRSNEQTPRYSSISGHMEWTIPSLLAYSNNNETHKESQWFMYIMELVKQSLRYCQMDTTQTVTQCTSPSSAIRALSTYVTKVISSLLHTRPDLSLHNTCLIGVDFRDPRLLFISYLGKMDFSANCSSTWEVHMHPTCAINITIATEHWKILEVQCLSLHRIKLHLCEGSQLTQLQFLACLECACKTELTISQIKPNHTRIGSVCGHLPPQTFIISGNVASISLKQNKHIPNRIRFIVQYQCNHIRINSYESTTLFLGKRTNILATASPATKTINQNYLHHVNRRVYNMVTVTVDLMHQVYLNINLSPPMTNITDTTTDSSIILVDGPMSATDAVNYFPVHRIMGGMGSARFVHQRTWTSTLNDATVISSYELNTKNEIIHLKYGAKLMPCQPHICRIEIKHVPHNLPMQQVVFATGTHIYNYTYVMETPIQDYLAINVTHLYFDGFYSMSCRYGSVTFYFAGTSHDQDNIIADKFNIYTKYKTYTSPQMVIGSYCSPSTIDGLLEVAKPLYLGKGTLSVVLKTYRYVTKISMNYTILTNKCMGVVDSYLVNKYGDYVYQEYTDVSGGLLLAREQSVLYTVFVIHNVYYGSDMYVEIRILHGYCFHYQMLTADYDLTLMSIIWLVPIKTWSATQQVVFLSPHSVTRVTPTHLAVDTIIPDNVIYIWNYISRMSILKPMFARIVSDVSPIDMNVHGDSTHEHVDSFTLFSYKHVHSLGVSSRFTIGKATEVGYTAPLLQGICYFLYYLIDAITLLSTSTHGSQGDNVIAYSCPSDVKFLHMLNTKQYWQFKSDQHFRDVMYHIISSNHCMSMLKVAYMYTRYGSDEPIIPYADVDSTSYLYDFCAVSEYRNFTVGGLVSLGTRHKWRGLTLASDDPTNWKHDCNIDVMFHYEKSEPFSGFPPYQAAALVDIEAPNEWRMCRLGRCYMLRDHSQFPKVSTWDEAERFCQSHNGHLLSINSDTEQSVVLDWLLRRPFTRNFKGIKRTVILGYMAMYLRASIIYIGLKASLQVGIFQVCG